MSAAAPATAAAPAARETRAEKKARKRRENPPLEGRDRLRRMGLMVLSGVLTFLSFPFTTERDSNLWPLAWFALVPFLEAIRGLRGKQAFWFGALGGLVTNVGGFWWISAVLREFGHLPFYVYWPLTLLNAFYQGLMFAVFALLVARLQRRLPPERAGVAAIWQIAALFTVVEWLYPMIFPWYLANGQYRFLPAIQIAEIGGVMSITFVMVAFNAALHRLWVQRVLRRRAAGTAPGGVRTIVPELPRRALIATFLGTAAVLVYGQIRVAMVDADIAAADKIKLGLVEADIGIFEKQAKHLPPREQQLTLHRNLLKHQIMSSELERRGVDLVVWPESSFFPLDDPYIKRSDRMAVGLGKGGVVLEWAYDAPSDRFVWRPVEGLPPAPGLPGSPAVPGLAAAPTALAVLRDDRFVTLGAEGLSEPGSKLPATPAGASFTAVALASASGFGAREDAARTVVWVAGRGGALAFGRLGEPLAAIPSGTSEDLTALAMRNGREGVAVGAHGTIVMIEKEAAKVVDVASADASLAAATLRAVAWADATDPDALALAVGDDGVVAVRLDGGWTFERMRGEPDLVAVAFDRDGAPWVAGRGGFVARREGGAWREVPLPGKADVLALTVDPLGAALVSDAGGGLWVRARGATAPGAAEWSQAATSAPGLGPVTAMGTADWVQTTPLPRDVRWIRQSEAPLPTLEAFDKEPAIELAEVGEADRASIQRGYATPILLGGLTWAPPLPGKDRPQLFNTAIMIDQRGRVLGTYDKVYLLAFGEYMPFGDTFPGLYKAFPQAGRFSAGNEVRTFTWRGHRLGIMICYEDIMVDFTGKLADLDPNVIINVTNDAWFGRTSEPWLHLALAVFRAVENRRTLVRSTNTGISAFIDPTGRLGAATHLDDAETLVSDVPVMHGGTIYGTVGNLFAWLALAALVAEAALAWWHRRAAATPPTATAASTAPSTSTSTPSTAAKVALTKEPPS